MSEEKVVIDAIKWQLQKAIDDATDAVDKVTDGSEQIYEGRKELAEELLNFIWERKC